MTRAYAVFLNGGWLVQPTLIRPDLVRQMSCGRYAYG